MDLEALLALLGENEEAKKFVTEMNANTESLTKRINVLENDSKKAFETRDTTKQKAKKLLDKLGLDDLDGIDDETLDKVLKGKGSDAEVQNLKAQLEKLSAEKANVENEYKSKLSDYALKSELTKTGLAQKALNGEVYAILEGLALQGAKYTDDGRIVYLNEDGTTKYSNGKEMSLVDRVAELSKSEAYAPLFKAEGKGGSGANPQPNKPANQQEGSQPLVEMYGEMFKH
jgi:chaperonin cofactor prefoldin